jgi:pimeloyl-ACP methyl ester carboxylesterase
VIERVPLADDYGRPAEPAWRGTDWSAYERDNVIAGRRLHYLEAGGADRAFVLVHGMGGRWQHWLETIPALVDQGRVLALDLPGFGRRTPRGPRVTAAKPFHVERRARRERVDLGECRRQDGALPPSRNEHSVGYDAGERWQASDAL